MSRKLSKLDFARIWGDVSRLSVKDWDALVALRIEQQRAKPTTVRPLRKPRVGTPGAATP